MTRAAQKRITRDRHVITYGDEIHGVTQNMFTQRHVSAQPELPRLPDVARAHNHIMRPKVTTKQPNKRHAPQVEQLAAFACSLRRWGALGEFENQRGGAEEIQTSEFHRCARLTYGIE